MQIPDIVEYIIKIGAAGGAIFGGYKVLKKPTMKWYQNAIGITSLNDNYANMVSLVENQGKILNTISQELTVNGGNRTIKDDLTFIKNELKVQNARMQDIITLSRIPTFICNVDGECTAVNQQILELFGATRDEMLGTGWIHFILDVEKDQKRRNWENAVENDSFIKDRYHIRNGKTGQVIYCEYSANITRDAKGHVISIMGTVAEVKE